MSALVYQAINAVTAELATSGIAKTHSNDEGDYRYRSIEDVLAALAPLLARHKLCVLPRMLEREALACGASGQLVIVRAAFDLVSALDGSHHTIESFGEALDEGDKGSAKAMSAAYKAAMLQAFCIPVRQDDGDARSPLLAGPGSTKTTDRPAASAAANRPVPGATAHPEPVEGWDAWAGEVMTIAGSCETAEAIERLTASRRQLLAALQRSRPDLYAKTGEVIAARLAGLQRPASPTEAAIPVTAVAATATAVAEAAVAGTAPRTAKRKPRKESADAAAQPAEAA